VSLRIAEHDLGIHKILGASKTDQADFSTLLGTLIRCGVAHRVEKEVGWLLLVIQGIERTRESCRTMIQVLSKVAVSRR
jgi:hypothetical protein